MKDGWRTFDPVRLLTSVGALALAVMLLWTMTDVFARLLLNKPLAGTLDLVEVTLVLVVFLALPECFRRDEQIKVDVFDAVVGRRGLALMRLIGEIATLVFLVLLAAALVDPVRDAFRFGDQKPDLPVPIFLLLAAIELALVASALVVAVRVVRQARGFPAMSGGEPGGAHGAMQTGQKEGAAP
jgi:TRAP-type C4-dicarboxylate transport system permease small subunit